MANEPFGDREVHNNGDDNGRAQEPIYLGYSPLSRYEKIVVFMCICFLGFGAYFSYDAVSALQPHFLTDLKISPSKYMLFNSLSQWANVFCSLAGGIIIDKVLGLRKSAVLFSGFAVTGQVIFATSIFFNCYYPALMGRFIFGLGTDSLGTVQNSYTVRYFTGKNINMLFGIHLTTLRLGSVLALNVQDKLYASIGNRFNIHGTKLLGATLHCSSIFVGMSLIFACILYKIDKEHEPKLQDDGMNMRLLENEKSKNTKGEFCKKIIDDIVSINPKIWHVAVTLIFFYNGLSPLYSQGIQFFSIKYHLSLSKAGTTMSLIDFISAALAPIVGMIADKYKNNIYLGQFGIMLCLLGMGLLNLTFISPIICVMLLGLGFSSLSSSMWPYINTNVPKEKIGTVNGIISSVQALIMGNVILMSGHLLQSYGYFVTNSVMMMNLLIAFTLNTDFIIIHGKGVSASNTKGNLF